MSVPPAFTCLMSPHTHYWSNLYLATRISALLLPISFHWTVFKSSSLTMWLVHIGESELSWCFWHFRITKWQMAFRRWQSRTTVSPLRVSNQHVVVLWSVSSYCWEGLCTHTVLLLVWCSTVCCQRIVPHSCMSSLCCHVARGCRMASVSLVFVLFAVVIRSVSKEQMTMRVRTSVVVML